MHIAYMRPALRARSTMIVTLRTENADWLRDKYQKPSEGSLDANCGPFRHHDGVRVWGWTLRRHLVYHDLELLHLELLAVAGHDRARRHDLLVLRILVALCTVPPQRPSLMPLLIRLLALLLLR